MEFYLQLRDIKCLDRKAILGSWSALGSDRKGFFQGNKAFQDNGLFVRTEQICVDELNVCLAKAEFCTLQTTVCFQHQPKIINLKKIYIFLKSELYIMKQRKSIHCTTFCLIKVSDIKWLPFTKEFRVKDFSKLANNLIQMTF